MKQKFKAVLFICCLCLSQAARAVTDYANNTTDYEGEYKSTHNDITTLGVQEKEPSLEQADEIRKEKLEKEVEPVPDIDPTLKPDKILLQKISNGSTLVY